MILLPEPQSMTLTDAWCSLPADGQIMVESCCAGITDTYAVLLQSELEESAGFRYGICRGYALAVISLSQDESLERQEYRLSIREKNVRITGGSSLGILYGIQTLRQILCQAGAVLPCLMIEDRPDFPVRGFYHDVTRGRVPTLAWLKQLADLMSYYKLNQLQLYVEHSYLFQDVSELWRDDTPLTAQEIMELDRYCLERGIELVPSMSTFGHLYKLLSTKRFRQYAEREDAGEQPFGLIDRLEHHTMDACSEEGRNLIKEMIREYLPLFSSNKFNLCADETFDLGKGRNRTLAEQGKTGRLYIEYVKDLCSFVKDFGSEPMIWGDILQGFPELAKELPEGTLCLNWDYAPDVKEDSTRLYAAIGIRQYVCPGVSGWNQLVNLQQDAYENIRRMSAYGLQYGCEGLLNTDWGDFGHINHPTHSIPGLIYGAEASWNRAALPDYEEMNRRISILEYQDASGKLMDVTGRIAGQVSFGWREAVYFKERWFVQGRKQMCAELVLRRDRIVTARKKQKILDECILELKRCTASIPCGKRSAVYSYILAAEGIGMLNRLGEILLRDSEGKLVEAEDADTLARELETWYYRYRQLWYTLSKESEVYRIGEVLNWYADYLRDQYFVDERGAARG